MSLLGRILGRTEARSMAQPLSMSYLNGGGHRTASGMPVNAIVAENLSGVTACINAVATAMGSLPPLAYRRSPDGTKVELQNHWVNRIIRRPNPWMTWPDLIEFVIGDTLLRGNSLLAIESDAAGRPVALIPLPWSGVQVEQLPNGRLIYVASRPSSIDPPRRYLDDEVFHLRDRSDNGMIGRSRISRAPDIIGNAASLQDWSGSTWKNQATPSGALEVQQTLNQEEFDRLRRQLSQQFTGSHNGRKVLILDNKTSWKSLSVSPEDAEVLSSRRFSIEEVARLFGVPPPIIGDLSHGTFTNSETLIRYFAQSTLLGWCNKFEAEFARSVLGTGNGDLSINLDLSGLLRGATEQRWATYAIAIQNNILTVDEIRQIEGYNPRPAQDGGAA